MAGEQAGKMRPPAAPLTPEEEEELLLQLIKKRRLKRRPPKSLKMNMTPMIDVVFLLIIFFMLVSEFQKMEIESVTLPYAIEAIEDSDPEKHRMVVNVTKEGEIRVMRRSVDPEQLLRIIESKAAQSPKDEMNLPTLHVKIRADADCEYKHVLKVMEKCMRAYVWRLSFGVQPLEDDTRLLY
jgi:biopolymer transport protein ExbD